MTITSVSSISMEAIKQSILQRSSRGVREESDKLHVVE